MKNLMDLEGVVVMDKGQLKAGNGASQAFCGCLIIKPLCPGIPTSQGCMPC